MSHFYGTIYGNRGAGTRCGTKDSGMVAIAASWDGCIRTYTWYDVWNDVNKYEVYLIIMQESVLFIRKVA